METKRAKIAVELTKLILVAFAIAVCFFIPVNMIVEQIQDVYVEKHIDHQEKNKKRIHELNIYLKENQISSDEWGEIQKWVSKKRFLSLRIYKNKSLVYDSEYYEDEEDLLDGNESEYESKKSKKVYFTDGEANAILFDYSEEKYYYIAYMIEFAFAVLIFFLIILLGIRKKVRYIEKINNDIHILEGGNLDYIVSVKGSDELAMLATSIEELRKAFQKKLDENEEIRREGIELVTEMSHDLRTPLTALRMYLEFAGAEMEKYPKLGTELKEYIKVAIKNADYIKAFSDDMFEFFITNRQNADENEKINFKEAFYEPLSSMTGFLQEEGFTVTVDQNFPDRYVVVNQNYIVRILNNIVSNIQKYADPNKEIILICKEDEKWLSLSFKNGIRKDADEIQGTGLGQKIMNSMLEQMNGKLEIAKEQGIYEIKLKFKSSEK